MSPTGAGMNRPENFRSMAEIARVCAKKNLFTKHYFPKMPTKVKNKQAQEKSGWCRAIGAASRWAVFIQSVMILRRST